MVVHGRLHEGTGKGLGKTTWSVEDIPDPRVRFKVAELETGQRCWYWRGAKQENGYGYFVRRTGGKQRKTYVHRYAYATFVGPIAPGLEVHHSCYNRWCLKPEHLSAMTHAVNCKDHGT